MDAAYVQTVRLLLETAPVLFNSPQFVMKGGTAINLFIQDMPRLSVDIDVVWKDQRLQGNRPWLASRKLSKRRSKDSSTKESRFARPPRTKLRRRSCSPSA